MKTFLTLVLVILLGELTYGQNCEISGPSTACTNQPTYFYGFCLDADGYQWLVNGVYQSNGYSLSYTFPTPGSYQITLYYSINGNFVADPTDVFVEVSDGGVLPIIQASPSEICNTGNVTLTVSNPQPGTTYSWTSNPTGYTGSGTSITFNGVTQSTEFFVTASIGTCQEQNSIDVNVVQTTSLPQLDPHIFYRKRIIRSSTGSSDNYYHYWQTSSEGTEITKNLVGDYTVTVGGNYYSRRRSVPGNCWATASSPIQVVVGLTPPLPQVTQLQKAGFNEVLFTESDKVHVLMFADYYWVEDGSSDPEITGQFIHQGEVVQSKIYESGTYYLKGKDRDSGTWGPTRTLEIDLRGDEGLNWVHTRAFDGSADTIVVAESKSYFDDSGRPLQSQSKDISRDFIFATQSLKDAYNRTVGSTLPAPIVPKEFTYNSDFVIDPLGKAYDHNDFDGADTKYNAIAVGDQTPGTVGWYYSVNNTLEENVPVTNYPYSRTEFYEDGTGEVKRSASPGDQHRLGMGHEVLSGTFPVFNELDDYIERRPTAIAGITQDSSLRQEGVQTVSRDENGKYASSIADKSGKGVMTARKGTQEDHVLAVTNYVQSSADPESPNFRKYSYFYILNDIQVGFSGDADFDLENIVTGEILPEEMLTVGVVQEGEDPSPDPLPAGFYRVILDSGAISFSYTNYYLDVSYQFYDDMGRLKTSVSPNGFKKWKDGATPETFYSVIDKTTYVYNFRGWLLSMTEPDAGLTRYVYRRDGKIRFSQNAEQKKQGRFSYTHYDNLGRPVESGEYKGTTEVFIPMDSSAFATSSMRSQLEFPHTVQFASSDVKDWVKSYYDWADNNFYTETGLPSGQPESLIQEFVRGAVSYTENASMKTWYSYDELGRVTWMAQKPTALARVFISTYQYDFLGNVLLASSLSYESGVLLEQFHHHYQYDADKRLSKAFTSTDGATKKLRALYEYYLHGPLKRIELGGMIVDDEVVSEVQGIDFVYNINGWLTQINHPNPSHDPGGDDNDVFGMILEYYDALQPEVFEARNIHERSNPDRFHHLPDNSIVQGIANVFTPVPAFGSKNASLRESLAQVRTLAQYEVEANRYPETEAEVAIKMPDADEPEVEIAIPDGEPFEIDTQHLTASLSAYPAMEAPTEGNVPDALEFAALKVLYDSLGGAGWTNKTGWPTPGNWPTSATAAEMDEWYGITVTNGDVTTINLPGNNLDGKIPSAIGNLTQLIWLILNSNNLKFTIPDAIGSLASLKYLYLHTNQFSGSIPSSIGNLTQLMRLYLYSNGLTGSIPQSLGNLTNLTLLDLKYNQLSGEIPSTIGNLTKLTYVELNNNQLSGSIPSSMNNLVNLTNLRIFTNNFTGDIPDLNALTKMQFFYLYNLPNINPGPLPEWLGQLTDLRILIMSSVKRTGPIPESFANLTKLTNIQLQGNQLTGSIPSWLFNKNRDLVSIYLHSNQFTGIIPASLGELTKLKNLNLYSNQLTGSIPETLGNLPVIETISLGTNQLSGSIPPSIGNLVTLKSLAFHQNQLFGEVPPTINNLTQLTTLQLNDNNLTGNFPEIGNLSNLKTLYAYNNKFTSIPESVLTLPNLTLCYFYSNSLETIPNFANAVNKANLTVKVFTNYLPFAQLEPVFSVMPHGIKSFQYSGQRQFNQQSMLAVPMGSVLNISAPSAGNYSTITWERQTGSTTWVNVNSLNEDVTRQTFKLSDVTNAIHGYVYRWKMTNSQVPAITLQSDPITIYVTDQLAEHVNDPGLYNGIISSMRWRTNEAYGTGQGDLNGMYQFRYDDKYQIEDANWAEPNHSLGTFTLAGNKNRVTNMAYDPNGNILSLNRYDASAFRTNNFAYTYSNSLSQSGWTGQEKNQLQSVSGYANAYTYNAIGQLTHEDQVNDEMDKYIVYDVSGKVVRVYTVTTQSTNPPPDPGGPPGGGGSPGNTGVLGQEDNEPEGYALRTEYKYDDRGFRLAKINHETDVTTWYIRDASGNVLSIYEQKPGQEIVQTEIPVYGSGKLATVYPQQNGSAAYEITDHLGNVRALVKEQVITYTATLEDNGQTDLTNPRVQEMAYFENLFETEVNDPNMNHTPDDATIVSDPSRSAYLYWVSGTPGMDAIDKSVGPAIALQVTPGDTIKAEAYVRYRNETSFTRSGFTLGLLSSVLGNSFAYTGGFEGATLTQTTQSFSDALLSGGFLGDGTDDSRPYAYLSYIVLDENYNHISSGWQRVSEAAEFFPGEEGLPDMHEKIQLNTPVVIGPEGKYIYVWVSNESQGARVWFDDVKITHTTTYVAQATDYGVWGDVLTEQRSEFEDTYRFGYQGQFAEKDDETGWNHFELREYDPVIGRWTATDPKRIGFSPYIGMYNNPISGIDLDGGGPPTDYVNEQTGQRIHIEDGRNDVVTIQNENWSDFVKFIDLTSFMTDPNQRANILGKFGTIYLVDDMFDFQKQHKNPEFNEWGAKLLHSGNQVSLSPDHYTNNDPYHVTIWGSDDPNEKANFHVHYTPFAQEGTSPTDKEHKGIGIYNVLITPNNIYFYRKGEYRTNDFGKSRWTQTGVDFTIPRK